MSTEFFQAKRPWSKYKDLILQYYLKPYVPKVAKLGKPIVIFDCFAGCGRFGDGEPGSPLIICDAISSWRNKGVRVSTEFIEAVEDNFALLSQNLSAYRDFATSRRGRFEDHITEISSRARSATVFLYIDPYTVKGLDFDRMKTVYDQIGTGASVEVLMNFNVATFMRWALAALRRSEPLPIEVSNDDVDYQADDPNERVEISTLNGIAGGDYWHAIASDIFIPFAEKIQSFTNQYIQKMRASFAHVHAYPVKEKYEHQVPKYMLNYATRHPDGLAIMNEAMCKARKEFLNSQFKHEKLFDMTPSHELPDIPKLKEELLRIATTVDRLNRKQLRLRAIPLFFCRLSETDMNQAISELLKSNRLFSATGKTRINDDVPLSSRPFE